MIANIKQSMDHPFSGTADKEKKFLHSLDENGRRDYRESVRKFHQMWHLARTISGVGSGELKLKP